MNSRRSFLKKVGLGSLAFTGLATFSSCSKKQKPNFLFILVDDLGWTDLGCYGSSFYETPNIDQLATEGTQFTQAYAACPVCSPTRGSIMTGKYPARTNTTDWFGAPQPHNVQNHWTKDKPLLPAPYEEKIALEEKTMAETFKENGYSTFFAGKWHLGPKGFWPTDQGFDINKGGWERGGPYGPGKYFVPYGNPTLEDGPKGEHLPQRLASETIKFITESKDKPFLAYLAFYSVHTPLMTTKELEEKYNKKRDEYFDPEQTVWGTEGDRKFRLVQEHAVYAGMVEAMDTAVGRVIKSLKDQNLDKNTVIIFMSDNGGLSTSEGHPTSNLPLRAGKGWLYEGGIREPMIVKWPGSPMIGKKCNHPVISTDFYPTMLDIAGLPSQPKQHLDGISFTPLLNGEKSLNRNELYWHYPHYGNQGSNPGAAIREGNFKLIEYFEDNSVELYNIKDDIGEQINLADEMPDKVKEMQNKLHDWQKTVNARFPSPNPNAKK